VGRIESARFLELHLRRGDVAGGHARVTAAGELLDERRCFHFLACVVAQDAGLIVQQVLGQDLGRQVNDALKVALGHRLARLLHRRAGVARHEIVDVDRERGVAGLFEELLGRVEHRIHLQDQSAACCDLVRPPEVVERDRLLKRRDDAVFDCGRQ
jgi:hypothetical protein